MRRRRVLLAGLFHETNTFLPGHTASGAFTLRRGAELLAAEGDGSPLDGALEVGRACGWEIIPVIDLRATPGAIVPDAVVETFRREFTEAAERQRRQTSGVDGVFLVLHGAMVSKSLPDVEGEILRRIRSLPGLADVPLAGTLDLHANVTDAMARYSSGLIAYRENPHTDAREAAVKAAQLLDRLMRTGEKPVTVREQPSVLWPPTGVATAAEPMRTLEARAREIEAAHPEILTVDVFAGFPFADVREAGVSFTAVTLGDAEEARTALRGLSELALSLKTTGNVIGMPLAEALRRLPEHLGRGPALLVEPSDNIGAGAPGDGTHIARALAESGIREAGVILNDPDAVSGLSSLRPGQRSLRCMGGRSGPLSGDPLRLDVELICRSDGRFRLEDRRSHLASLRGEHIDMGPCAVVRHGGLRILLTSRKTPPFDLGQWRSQGIDPESLAVIGVKAAVAHRQAYDPIASASYTVETPGPCASDLRTLPFRHVRRPVYPLDDLEGAG